MAKKPSPITRAELLSLAVTDVDAWGAQSFLRHRENVPAIPDLEEKGEKSFPGMAGVLGDLFHSLWAPEPAVKEEVTPDRRYWKELLGRTVESGAYQELHAQTQLKDLLSVMGMVAMGESIVASIPDADKEKVQELAQAQTEASQLQGQADSAQQGANAQQQLADAAVAQSHGGGSGEMSAEQATALANQLAQEAMQAKAKADGLQKQADNAKARAEALVEEFLGKAGSQESLDKMRELTRIGLAAVKNAQAKVEEVSETIEAWGLEEGELRQESIPEALGLLERMKRNDAFKKLSVLLGRVRKIATRKARQKIAGEGARVQTVETGRDIRRAQTSELVALVHPALRVQALTRLTRGELRLHGQRVQQKLGHGPVIVCEDGSGSMDGAKQQWAKAVTLGLAYFAKLQKRSFGWIMFDYAVHKSNTYPQGQVTARQMLEIAEARAGGGTDFESPLRRALEMIRKEGLKKADIAFITDGECAVSDKFLREFLMAKKELEFNVVVVLCDVGSTSDKAVAGFSDRIEHVSSYTAETADAQIFARL